MPLVVRRVQPQSIKKPPERKADPLKATTVFTISSLIQQIGDVAKLSEDILGGLADSVQAISRRALSLEERLQRLDAKVKILDAKEEVEQLNPGEVRLTHEHFASNQHVDQQLLAAMPLSAYLTQVASKIESLEPLGQFKRLRDDGKDPIAMVSCPGFFFEHWRYVIQKETTKRKSFLPEPENDPSVIDFEPQKGARQDERVFKPRSPDLLLQLQVNDHNSLIHRRQRVNSLRVPHRGESLPIASIKQDERKTLFQLFDVDIPARCTSVMANNDEADNDGQTQSQPSLIEREEPAPKNDSPKPSDSSEKCGSLLYQDEDCVVYRQTDLAEKKKRRFSWKRMSFRKSTQREKKVPEAETEVESNKPKLERKGSFLSRRGSFRRKSTKKKAKDDSSDVPPSNPNPPVCPTPPPPINDTVTGSSNSDPTNREMREVSPYTILPRDYKKGDITSPPKDASVDQDSGIDATASSLEADSRTTSVSSSTGTLGRVARQTSADNPPQPSSSSSTKQPQTESSSSAKTQSTTNSKRKSMTDVFSSSKKKTNKDSSKRASVHIPVAPPPPPLPAATTGNSATAAKIPSTPKTSSKGKAPQISVRRTHSLNIPRNKAPPVTHQKSVLKPTPPVRRGSQLVHKQEPPASPSLPKSTGSKENNSVIKKKVPPPVPPRKTSSPTGNSTMANGHISQSLSPNHQLFPSSSNRNSIKEFPRTVDVQNELLVAIKSGIHLRKVHNQRRPTTPLGTSDVAAILQRRFALMGSESSDNEKDGSPEWED